MAKIAVIGYGNIGKFVAARAPAYGHEVALVVSRRSIENGQGEILVGPDSFSSFTNHLTEMIRHCVNAKITHAMIAIPSGGDGMIELGYALTLIEAGIKVVTAGKSALANQFLQLQEYLRRIKYDAACGGGTMILPYLKNHLYVNASHPFVVTMVINGTLNFAQSRVRDGISAEQIVQEALKLGFAEPAADGKKLTPLDMYDGEFGDIQRKMSIVCNTLMLPLIDNPVTQNVFRVARFTESQRARVMAGNSNLRYLVRFCTRRQDLEFFADVEDHGGHVIESVGELFVASGFVELKGALLKWVPDHVGNACHVVQNGETVHCVGQGAGPVPTVGTMYSNLHSFLDPT